MDNGVRINPMMLQMLGQGARPQQPLADEALQPSQPHPAHCALGGSVADLEIDDDDF